MDFNEYELQLVAHRRLAEFRATAARHAMFAGLERREPGVRARIGRQLVRLGHFIEGRTGRSKLPSLAVR